MLTTEIVDGRTVYLYGDTEISAEEYAALKAQQPGVRVRKFSVSVTGKIEEVTD